ncbi:MAG: ATP-binding protein [Bacteroidales bacterium]|nr:ATP-binding protein [Bacteroidales bacterium]
MYKRAQYDILAKRLAEKRRFIQVIMGPRQVGKSTLMKQVVKNQDIPYLFYTADAVPVTNFEWISDCWNAARTKMKVENLPEIILIIDEIQKIIGWSEIVKKEWDDDSFNDIPLKVILLGSSRVMLDKGLADSLQGRFERIILSHWSFAEMRDAFGFSLEQFIYYGAYPGAAELIDNPERWINYISGSIVDATINKDILVNEKITKPALLRQTFELSSAYSGQELSLTKMIGQMTDAGNTTTITGYLNLLSQAGLVCGLNKYAVDMARKKNSIPKHQVYNNALKTLYCEKPFEEAILDRKLWGRLFESAIGAHILSYAYAGEYKVYYWRTNPGCEVDYVLEKKGKLVAIEVKSNDDDWNDGLSEFKETFKPYLSIIVGRSGIPAEDFLSTDPVYLFK